MSEKVLPGEKHYTASVWIISKTFPKKILLIHHKKLEKWLQPGGHIERFENPLEAAIREVKEETGLDISFLRQEVKVVNSDESMLPLPGFLMEHVVPSTAGKPAHFHIDISYIVELSEQSLKPQLDEVYEIGWFSKQVALQLPIHADTRLIIDKLL